jgi:hypothetical protein
MPLPLVTRPGGGASSLGEAIHCIEQPGGGVRGARINDHHRRDRSLLRALSAARNGADPPARTPALEELLERRAARLDVEHVDGPRPFVDAIADPVRATPSATLTLDWYPQRRAHSVRVAGEGVEDELDARRSHWLRRSLGEARRGAPSHDHLEGHPDDVCPSPATSAARPARQGRHPRRPQPSPREVAPGFQVRQQF